MEGELGQRLFSRTTRSVRLTPAGAHLLPDIIGVLSAQAALLARAGALSNPSHTVIRIGVSPVVSVKFVDVVIEPFRLANREVEVIFRELNLAEMLSLLERGQLDFVFGPVDAQLSDAFESAPFHQEPLVFVASSRTKVDYSRAKSISLKELSGETFVMMPDACGLTRTTRELFRQKRFTLHEYSGQALSYGVLQEWAGLGIGSAILPRSKLLEGSVPEILITDGGRAVQIHYRSLWRGGAVLAPEVDRLATFLKDVAPTIAEGLAH